MAVELLTRPELNKQDTRLIDTETAENVEEMVTIVDRLQMEVFDSLGNLASRLWVSTAETSNPPTSAQLDAAFGRKEDKRDGFAAWINVGGTGQVVCLVVCIQNKWWQVRTAESSSAASDPVTLTPGITTNERSYFGWNGSTTLVSTTLWSVTANEQNSIAVHAIDGNTSTRWRSLGDMSGDEVFSLDMGQSETIGGIHLDNSLQSDDYPRVWRVDTSPDDVTYTTQISGDESDYPSNAGGAPTSQHSLESPNAQQTGRLRLYFNESVTCRYIKVYQFGHSVGHSYSIHELQVVEPLPSGALFGAGVYTILYSGGAMQYSTSGSGLGYSVHSPDLTDEGFYIEHSGQSKLTLAPGEHNGSVGAEYDDPGGSDAVATAAAEAGSDGLAVTINHTGGTIGILLFDRNHLDNTAAVRSVKYALAGTEGPTMPSLNAFPAFIFPPPVFQDDVLERFFLEIGAAFTDSYRNIYQDLFNWTTHIDTSLNNVTDGGPTQAELNTAFGTPGQVRSGFTAVVDDAGAKARAWVVTAVNDKWWTLAMTAAA